MRLANRCIFVAKNYGTMTVGERSPDYALIVGTHSVESPPQRSLHTSAPQIRMAACRCLDRLLSLRRQPRRGLNFSSRPRRLSASPAPVLHKKPQSGTALIADLHSSVMTSDYTCIVPFSRRVCKGFGTEEGEHSPRRRGRGSPLRDRLAYRPTCRRGEPVRGPPRQCSPSGPPGSSLAPRQHRPHPRPLPRRERGGAGATLESRHHQSASPTTATPPDPTAPQPALAARDRGNGEPVPSPRPDAGSLARPR